MSKTLLQAAKAVDCDATTISDDLVSVRGVLIGELRRKIQEEDDGVHWLLRQMRNRDLATIRDIGKTYPL